MAYIPHKKILENYARVLVKFALGGGKGIKKGDTVIVNVGESARPLYIEILKAVWLAGGNVINQYVQETYNDSDNVMKFFYEHASKKQLEFFPKHYARGLVDEADHQLMVISETNKQALAGVPPKKIMQRGKSWKPYKTWRDEKENKGKFTWTLALYGTKEMAQEAGLSEKEYWNQIIKACFLDKKDPIAEWKKVYKKLETTRVKLNKLQIDKVHIQGTDADLWIKIGEKRLWQGGSGRNIPSFELFTSPDWRGTQGWIKFNQPLYRYGNLITGIELWFENGKVVRSKATKNEHVLRAMIATEHADKVGEFSLTDKRFSRITHFMAETLFDENIGGTYGNTHIALGSAYKDCYEGDPASVTQDGWEALGFNDSSVHTDIVSTTNRTVTAYLKNGTEVVIYKNGMFTI